MRRAYALVAIVATLFAASSIRAEEALCTALGSACFCSEPLNTNVEGQSGVTYNPGDSTTKACSWLWFGNTENWDFNGYTKGVSAVAETGMPAGNTVSWVWKQNSDDAQIGSFTWPSSSIRRMCTRVYQTFSSDYIGTGESGCTNNKIIDAPKWGSNQSYLTQGFERPWWISSSAFSGPDNGSGPEGNPKLSGDFMDHNNCKSQWCRFEVCWSGNILAGTNLFVDAEVYGLNDHKRMTITDLNLGSSGASFQSNEGAYEGFRGPTCHVGTRSVSHFMQAQWTTDTGQWIGAAQEVEGSGDVTIRTPFRLP